MALYCPINHKKRVLNHLPCLVSTDTVLRREKSQYWILPASAGSMAFIGKLGREIKKGQLSKTFLNICSFGFEQCEIFV